MAKFDATRIDKLTSWLSSLATEYVVQMEGHYWINGEEEAGNNYCREHAEARLCELKAANPDNSDDYHLSYGYGTSEEDGQAFCETCGKPLQCTLTDYGTFQELEHFEMCPPTLEDLHSNSGTAFALSRVLENGEFFLVNNRDKFPGFCERLTALVESVEKLYASDDVKFIVTEGFIPNAQQGTSAML